MLKFRSTVVRYNPLDVPPVPRLANFDTEASDPKTAEAEVRLLLDRLKSTSVRIETAMLKEFNGFVIREPKAAAEILEILQTVEVPERCACGSSPWFGIYAGQFAVRCENSDCPKRPYVTGGNEQGVRAAWTLGVAGYWNAR